MKEMFEDRLLTKPFHCIKYIRLHTLTFVCIEGNTTVIYRLSD
jgi:hypothetical protein